MTTKQESRPAPVQLKVHYQHQHSTPTIYADGLSQIQIGFPNSRLLLHGVNEVRRTGENNDAIENVQTLACELIMPTGALLELANNIVSVLVQNKAGLQQQGQKWLDQINARLAALDPASEP